MSLFKQRTTQRTLIAAALAAAFVGLSATAIAQNAGGPGMGHSPGMSADKHAQHMAQRAEGGKMGQRMEKMQKRHAEHQAQLKTALKLTAAQEPAWNAYVAGTAHTPPPMGQSAKEDMLKLTTPQRLEKMQAHKAARDAQMGKHIDAVKTFYAALTPEQQKVFDSQSHGGMGRAGMKGEHRMGGMDCDSPMHKPN